MSAGRVVLCLALLVALVPAARSAGPVQGDAARVASLEVHGYRFRAGREQATRWEGSGVWIGPDLLVTSASVVLRAREIVARGADGHSYGLDRVVLMDRVRDIAVLTGPAGPALPPLSLPARRGDAQRLRSTAVVALGARPDGSLSASAGHARGVAVIGGQEWIVHDAALEPGASGGALVSEDGTFLGLNTASGPAGRGFAIPSWSIARLHAMAYPLPSIRLETVFASAPLQAIPLVGAGPDAGSLAIRTVCMPPGGTAELELPVTGPGDVGIQVAPEGGARVHVRVALGDEAPVAVGLLAEPRLVLQSVERDRATLTLLFANPQGANAGRACATVRPHAVDWEARTPRSMDLW
jgi:serine protease Do